jgi:small-conductance mechanosensitive channel
VASIDNILKMPRDKLQPALLRRSKKAALIAITYLTLLVVPWILTCVLAGKTIRQSRDNSGALSPADAASRHQLAYLIDVLNLMAALAALPTMYALLARAAVVFSQRTDLKKTLNVKQLFALADRRFLTLRHSGSKMDKGGTSLAAVGAVLIVLGESLTFLPRGASTYRWQL